MALLSKSALLEATDLKEKEVELPEIGGAVRVRGLAAAYSNQANSEALVMKTIGRDQVATVDTAKMEVLQVLHGLVEPKLDSIGEAEELAKKLGPSFKRIVEAIDELSGVDKEAIAKTTATFPGSRASENGTDVAASDAGGEGPS